MKFLTFPYTSNRIKRAHDFAYEAHEGQRRKYTDEPYIAHPTEVARILWHNGCSEDQVMAGLLHDVIEDCGVTEHDLANDSLIGHKVAKWVWWLSDQSKPEDGNRAARKEIDRQHIAKAQPPVKTVKCADLISNTKSIVVHDPNFATTYLPEKLRILEVIQDADHQGLLMQAHMMTHLGLEMLEKRRLQEELLKMEMKESVNGW